MPTIVQFRRGTTAENNAFTGAQGELSIDTTLDVLRIHDGSTQGGFSMLTETATQSLSNKTLIAPTITGNITGNLVPAANLTYDLGASDKYWGNLYLAGNTIFLGSLQLKAVDGTTFGVFESDGTTQANLEVGNIDVSALSQGTSSIGISETNGNAFITISGTSNVAVFASTGMSVTGTATVTGNVSGGNITTAGQVAATGNVSGGNLVTAGDVTTATVTASSTVTATGNVSGGNITTAGQVAATGNVSGGNITTAGDVTTATVTASGAVTATGNVSGGNITTAGQVAATGNVSGGNITTAGVLNVAGAGVSSFAGNVDMNSNNILNLATPVNDADAATKLYVDNLVSTGIHFHTPVRLESPVNLNATYNQPGGPGDGVGATLTNAAANAALVIDGVTVNTSDRILVYQQTDQTQNGVYVVTTVGDGSTAWVLTRSTDADSYSPSTADGLDEGSYFYVQEGDTGAGESYVCNTIGTITFGTTNITFAQFSASQVYQAGTGLTLTNTTFSVDASQTQITAVGNLVALTVVGNVGADGFTAANSITAGTTVTALGNITGDYFIGNGSQLSGIDATSIQSGTSNMRVVTSGGNIDGNVAGSTVFNLSSTGLVVTGSIEATGGFIGLDATQIQSGTSNVSVISSGGNVDVNVGGNPIATFHAGGIDNRQANGVGNIGTATSYFNTVFAKATSAQYADLAEMYEADQHYEYGTVVSFDGAKEITHSTTVGDTKVAGIISKDPAYLMNATQQGEHVLPVALMGRVLAKVTDPVRKGDMMISAGDGTARACAQPALGSVIGKALENFEGESGVIEIVVGRL